MYCKYCGKENTGDAVFCSFCGKPLKDNAPSAGQKTYAPPVQDGYTGPVNMWGEPIDDLTREFHPVEDIPQPAEDISATRVAPAITDLSSTEATGEAPSEPEGEGAPQPGGFFSRFKNPKLVIGVIVATGVLLFVLMLTLVLTLVMPGSDPDATPPDQFLYTVEDDHVSIQAYIGKDKTVVIPSRIERTSVTTILANAFANRDLLSVTIPNSVTSIADTAFDGNPDLIIYGRKDSYAKLFAEKHNLTFALTGSATSRTETLTTGDNTTAASKTLPAQDEPETTTTTEEETTTTTRQTTTTAPEATHARTTAPPPATDPNASAASLLGESFKQVKVRLGSDYTAKVGGLSFPHHSFVEFAGLTGGSPSDTSTVSSVTITEGHITEDARIGHTMSQLKAMMPSSSDWTIQDNPGVGDQASFTMTYGGRTISVVLYFDGTGDSATCIQASVSAG